MMVTSPLTPKTFIQKANAATRLSPIIYWQIMRPNRTLKLSGAFTYANRIHSNGQDVD